jgi:hypothetical protein
MALVRRDRGSDGERPEDEARRQGAADQQQADQPGLQDDLPALDDGIGQEARLDLQMDEQRAQRQHRRRDKTGERQEMRLARRIEGEGGEPVAEQRDDRRGDGEEEKFHMERRPLKRQGLGAAAPLGPEPDRDEIEGRPDHRIKQQDQRDAEGVSAVIRRIHKLDQQRVERHEEKAAGEFRRRDHEKSRRLARQGAVQHGSPARTSARNHSAYWRRPVPTSMRGLQPSIRASAISAT